jgi:hypothetical protein
MFEVKPYKILIPNLHQIASDLTVLLNDGVNDIIYTGTNPYGNRILAVIMFDDDENEVLRYIHVITTDSQFQFFLRGEFSFRKIIIDNQQVFIVDKAYSGEELSVNLIAVSDIPEGYMPLSNSFCPQIIRKPSFDYAINLKGELADLHKVFPLDFTNVTQTFNRFLSDAIYFLKDLEIDQQVYVKGVNVGSVQLRFQIEFSGATFSKTKENLIPQISKYLNGYIEYFFEKLPKQDTNIFLLSAASSTEIKNLIDLLSKIYYEGDVNIPNNLEMLLLDSIRHSTIFFFSFSNYKSFNKIELSNSNTEGELFLLATLDSNKLEAIHEKQFKYLGDLMDLRSNIPRIRASKEIDYDAEEFGEYQIRMYSLNTVTGKGNAYLNNNIKNKVTVYLKGLPHYNNTAFTKSMDESKVITINAKAKKSGGRIKSLTYKFN